MTLSLTLGQIAAVSVGSVFLGVAGVVWLLSKISSHYESAAEDPGGCFGGLVTGFCLLMALVFFYLAVSSNPT